MTPHNYGETYDYDPNNPERSNNVHSDHEWDLLYESAYIEEGYSWLAPTADPDEIEDDDKILLPPHVLGWVLRSRKWVRFNVDFIQDVSYTSGFDALVLPPGHKETVRALVANHARGPAESTKISSDDNSIDLVRGKGQGLVILLHGAPGNGLCLISTNIITECDRCGQDIHGRMCRRQHEAATFPHHLRRYR